MHRYIERRNRDDDLVFILQPQDNQQFLNGYILSEVPDRSLRAVTESDLALKRAADKLRRFVAEKLTDVQGTSLTPARTTRVLKDLRDRILALRVVWVETRDEDDAYVVFETLNTRGKDLEIADLLKNHLLGKLRTRNPGNDQAKNQWNNFKRTLYEGNPVLDADQFIQHWVDFAT